MGEEVAETGTARVVRRARGIKGAVEVPGDKSISHRAAILGALAEGTTRIEGLAPGRDVGKTLSCLHAMGAEITYGPAAGVVTIEGVGSPPIGAGLRPPDGPLDCGNSGTTARMLAGVLAGQGVGATLEGDESLSTRPMERVAIPLRKMGAEVTLSEEGTLPMEIGGGGLTGITYHSPVASAQVKSAVLFAALGATGATEHVEPIRSRDHTERLLKLFGADIQTHASGGGRGEYRARLTPAGPLKGQEVAVPGDISSAIFLVVAALLIPRSELILKDVGLNPGRREALRVLDRMGAQIEIKNRTTKGGESRGDLHVRHSKLTGTGISGASVAWMIDEIPALAVAAAFADGESYVKDAEELRHKESDRVKAIVHNLKRLEIDVGEFPDGFVLRGRQGHDAAEFESFGDHRIAMAFHVAALACHGESIIKGYDAVEVSWPGFPDVLEAITV